MKKLNLKKYKFPKIYRFITEKNINFSVLHKGLAFLSMPIRFNWQPNIVKKASKETKKLFKIIIVSCLVFAVIAIGVDLYFSYREREELIVKKRELTSQIKIWEAIVKKYPGYKDAYFRLSVMEYQIGNFSKAKHYIQKALALDPNFKEAEKLDLLLDSK